MKLNKKNPFEKIKLDVNLDLIDQCFSNIKLDPYAKGKYRYRALNRYIFKKGEWQLRTIAPLFQSSKYNSLWGDQERKFMELDFRMAMPELAKLFEAFLLRCEVTLEEIEVGVHSIRTLVGYDKPGHPAPEGVHSDGYMYTSIFVIRRDLGIDGAKTSLFKGRDKTGCLFSEVLDPGEALLIDDKSIFHYTSLGTTDLEKDQIRDILAITISPKDENPKMKDSFSK